MSKKELNKYKIAPECIGCRACVDISNNNFALNKSGKADVVKQPENEEEEKHCTDAAMFCPVSAIITVKNQDVIDENEEVDIMAGESKKFSGKGSAAFGGFLRTTWFKSN